MIERRDASSRADAAVLASSRSAAAARALAGLRAEVEAHDREARSSADAGADAAAGISHESPLLEVRPSAFGADVEHIGVRLCVFADRVELRDRGDRPREVIRGADITDIVLHRRLGGTVLTIECVEGPAMVTRGLRHDEAEAARTLIMRRTRRVGPVTRGGRPHPAGPGTGDTDGTGGTGVTDLTDLADLADLADSSSRSRASGPGPGWRPAVDEAGLLGRLADLHRAGVLTDAEFEDKIEVVARLVRGEPAAGTGGSSPAGAPAS